MPTPKKKIVSRVLKPKKPALKKTEGKRMLTSANGYLCFWVNKGPILRNLLDLKKALSTMTEAQFAHHVSKSKNDFAIWTKQVLKDAPCADALHKATSKEEALKIVSKHLEDYLV